jgi:hypothetical protein
LLQQGDRLPKDRYCVAVLRHPFDRFLSEYFYNKIDCSDRPLDIRLLGLDLDAYLEQLSLDEQEVIAVQIRMLYPLGTSSQTILSQEEKFTAAVKAIDSFEFIGLQEELEDFSCMLSARFGWKHIPLTLKNATSRRIKSESLSYANVQKLSSLFQYELELYQYAKSRFQACRREFLKQSVAMASSADININADASSEVRAPEVMSTSERQTEFGDKRCVIEEVSVVGEISGGDLAMVGEYFDILLRIKSDDSIDTLNIGISIRDERGLLIFSANSMQLGHVYSLQPGEYMVRFNMLNRMPRGNYRVDAALMKSENHYHGCYHWRENIASFKVHDSIVTHSGGHIFMDADVSFKSVTGESEYKAEDYLACNYVRSLGLSNKPLKQFKSIITPIASIRKFFPGMDICIPVRVENTSQEAWMASGKQCVALTYRWLTKTGEVIVADGVRTHLTADVLPGRAVVITMQITVPSESQSLQLVISLVQEAVSWFVDRNPDAAYVMPVELD